MAAGSLTIFPKQMKDMVNHLLTRAAELRSELCAQRRLGLMRSTSGAHRPRRRPEEPPGDAEPVVEGRADSHEPARLLPVPAEDLHRGAGVPPPRRPVRPPRRDRILQGVEGRPDEKDLLLLPRGGMPALRKVHEGPGVEEAEEDGGNREVREGIEARAEDRQGVHGRENAVAGVPDAIPARRAGRPHALEKPVQVETNAYGQV